MSARKAMPRAMLRLPTRSVPHTTSATNTPAAISSPSIAPLYTQRSSVRFFAR